MNRESFIELLETLQTDRKITMYSKWADTVKNHLIEEKVYLDLL